MQGKFYFKSLKGKGYLGELWNRWEYDIDLYHKEIVCGEVIQISLVQDRVQWWALVGMVMNFYVM
jgi:hypothetical protein